MLDSGEASSELVEHKYGEDAGGVTRDGFSIVKSVAEGSQAYRRIGLQSFAKQSVTGTLHTMNDTGNEKSGSDGSGNSDSGKEVLQVRTLSSTDTSNSEHGCEGISVLLLPFLQEWCSCKGQMML